MADDKTPVEAHIHAATRTNIPTAELEGVIAPEDRAVSTQRNLLRLSR